MVSWTVTRRPFQAEVALAISSPTFLGDYLCKVDERAWRTDKLWCAYQTKRTDLGGQGRGSTDLSSGCPQVDDLNLGRVLFKTSEHRFGLQPAVRLTILGAIFAEDECGDDGRCDLGINSWRGRTELRIRVRTPPTNCTAAGALYAHVMLEPRSPCADAPTVVVAAACPSPPPTPTRCRAMEPWNPTVLTGLKSPRTLKMRP